MSLPPMCAPNFERTICALEVMVVLASAIARAARTGWRPSHSSRSTIGSWRPGCHWPPCSMMPMYYGSPSAARGSALRPSSCTALRVLALVVFGGQGGDGVDLVRAEADGGGGEVLLEVLDAGRAGNRQCGRGAVQLPGQRDLLRRGVVFLGDRVDQRVERFAFRSAWDGTGVPGENTRSFSWAS